jgi:large repetitive protein
MTGFPVVYGAILLAIAFPLHEVNAQAPVVSSFSPTEGKPIVTRVRICGTNLARATAVEFNGTPNSFYLEGTGCLSAVVPPAASAGPITVRTPDGDATTADVFNVIPLGEPVISSFSPNSGFPEQNYPVLIHGENIIDATEILFNGVPATRFGPVGFMPGSEDLHAFIPTNATTGPITVKTPRGSFTTAEVFTVIIPSAPIVESFSPTSGPPDTLVMFYGKNFINLISVAFGGVEQAVGGGFTPDSCAARVGSNAQSGLITITTAFGTCTTKEAFTVLPMPPPAIASFSPKSGLPGTQVRIPDTSNPLTLNRVTEVRFNGVSAAFSYNGAAFLLVATVPANATSGPITLVSPAGTATSAESFTVLQEPVVTKIEPEAGPEGTVVRLAGSLLEQILSVTLGDLLVPYDKATLSFTVPKGAASGAVTVMTSYSQTVTPFRFEVTHDYDLALTASATLVANALHYSLTVKNRGTVPISSVIVSNVLFQTDEALSDSEVAQLTPTALETSNDPGLTVTSATATQGACVVSNQTVRCELGTLASNTSVSLQLMVEALRGGVIYQVAIVGGTEIDPAPHNNRIVTATTIWEPPVLSGFSPTSGTPGTIVEVYGTNAFGHVNLNRVTELWFGANRASFTWDSKRGVLTAIVPGNPNGSSGPITVVTPEAYAMTADSFTCIAEAVLSGLAPDHGAPGTVVELLGTNLDQVVSAKFGSRTVALTRENGFFFTVPPEGLSGPVTVYLPHSWHTSSNSFTVNRALDVGLIEGVTLTNPLAPAVIEYTVAVVNKGAEPADAVVLTNSFYEVESPIDTSGTPSLIVDASSSQGKSVVSGQSVRSELGRLDGFATATVHISVRAEQRGVVHHVAGLEETSADPDLRDNQLHSVVRALGSTELVISRLSPSQVELRWPGAASKVALQRRDQVPGSPWFPVQGSVLEVDGWSVARDAMSPQGGFYRLVSE